MRALAVGAARAALPAIVMLGAAVPAFPDTPAVPIRLELIDMPTAQVLPRGAYELSLRLLGGGSALGGARVGILDILTLGCHYGGSGIVASGAPDWNPRAEFYAKVRVLGESTVPGLALGFDSQGLGAYDDSLDRYEVKSRGVFAVSEKTWPAWGFFSLHGGISLSLEDSDGDDGPTLFVGMQKSLGDAAVFLAEYDLGLNDNHDDGRYGRGRGFLNTSFSWALSEAVSLELDLRNLAENAESDGSLSQWNREVRIRLAEFF
jgi:hypothetical protein